MIWLSRSAVLAALLACAPPSAAAETVVAPPPPPRHQLGVQVGGTGFLQVAYRFRLAGPVHLDTGLFGAPHGTNMSLGVLVMPPAGRRWLPYVGLGGGVAGAFGPKVADGCDPAMTDCPLGSASTTLTFLHARAGIAFAFDDALKNMFALDVGGWWGAITDRDTDAAGVKTQTSRRILWPMAGLAYLHAF